MSSTSPDGSVLLPQEVQAAQSWTTGSTTITLGADNPGLITPGMSVYDDIGSGPGPAGVGTVFIGTVASYTGTTLTLTSGAQVASQGANDTLSFGDLVTSDGTWTFGPYGGSGGYDIMLDGSFAGQSTGAYSYGFVLETGADGVLYTYGSNSLWVQWSDTANNWALALAAPGIVFNPITVTVGEDSGASTIGIPTLSYPGPYTQLNLELVSLPIDGTVTLDGEPVELYQSLSSAELSQLEFTPTPGLASGSSVLTYQAILQLPGSSNIQETAIGTVTLAVGSGAAPSSDGSVLYPQTGGSLITAAGTWTFGALSPIEGDYYVLLNGSEVATPSYPNDQVATLMEVYGGNQLFVLAGGFWLDYNSITQTFAVTQNPNQLALNPPNQAFLSADLKVAPNSGATWIDIPNPQLVDVTYANDLTIKISLLPTDGTVTLADGVTPVTVGEQLTVAQLTGLEFTPTSDLSNAGSLLDYTVSDPTGAFGQGYVALDVDTSAIATTTAYLSVPGDSAASAIGIVAPTDSNNGATLTITVTETPGDGVVTAGGETVTVGEQLTIGQLTSLDFTPTAGIFNQDPTLLYTATDNDGAAATGSATLSIQAQPVQPPSTADAAVVSAGVDTLPTILQPSNAGDVVGFDLQNPGSTSETAGQVTFNEVFAEGAVRPGDGLVAREADGSLFGVQMSTETTYADGSVEQAILTVAAPTIGAGDTLQFMLNDTGAASPLPALTAQDVAADLLTNGDVTANITVSGGGSFSASAYQTLEAVIDSGGTALADALWMSGPGASEYDVATTVDNGAIAVMFDITAYSDGATTTEVIFSTADTTVVSGTQPPNTAATVNYQVAIDEGGTQIYNDSGNTIQQYDYSMWNYVVSGGDVISPNVELNVPYLEETGAVENFGTELGVTNSDLGSIAGIQYNTSTTMPNTGPLGTGEVSLQMGAPGDRQDIGPQTNWTAEWLLSQNITAFQTMMANADVGGSVPWNYIDPATGQPIDLEIYNGFGGNTNVGGTEYPAAGDPAYDTGADVWGPDPAHQPDLNYIPYLVTGNPYQLLLLQEQADFSIYSAADYGLTYDFSNTVPMGIGASFNNVPGAGTGGDNLSNGEQLRGMAWSLRELAEAAYATPDTGSLSDPSSEAYLKNYFSDELDTAMNGLVQQYVTDDFNGQYGELNGFVEGSTGPENDVSLRQLGGFMEDYLAIVLGEVAGLDIPEASADAVTMLQYMNNWIAGLFTNGPAGYNPLDGSAYTLTVNNPVTDAPFTTWAQLFGGNVIPGWQNGEPGLPADPSEMINALNNVLGGYPQLALAALAQDITYTELPQAMQAYGLVASELSYAMAPSSQGGLQLGGSFSDGSGGTLAQAYQNYPEFDIVPRLPDGQYLEFEQMVFAYPAAGASVTSAGAPGVDTLLGTVGSGSVTLVGNSSAGGADLIYGGAGTNTLVAGSGNDYLFGGTGNTVLQAGGGNDYLQGGSNSGGPGTADTTSNTFEIETPVNAGQARTVTIVDFNPQNDLLLIGASITDAVGGGFVQSAAELLTDTYTTVSGGNTVIQLNPNSPGSDELVLVGVGNGGLTVANTEVTKYPAAVSAGSSVVVSSPDPVTSAVEAGGVVTVSGGGAAILEPLSLSGTAIVEAGGSVSSTSIAAGGNLTISAGGTANATTILAGGSQNIAGAAGSANNTTISGGSQSVADGGSADGTAVLDGGNQVISAGGTATGTVLNGGDATVLGGGTLYVVGGPATVGAVVNGGEEIISAGASASNTQVANGGVEDVLGSASGTSVSGGGDEIVSAGGTATGTTIFNLGSQTVLAGGAALNATVSSGGSQLVAGGTANGTTVLAGAEETVNAGASTVSTTLNGASGSGSANHAYELLSGTAFETSVGNGGRLLVMQGGQAVSATVGNGGVLNEEGGTDSGSLLLGGSEDVSAGSAVATIATLGGELTVSTGGTTVSAQIIGSGGSDGSETVEGGTALATTVSAGGSLTVSQGVESGGTVGSGGNETVLAGGTAIGTSIVGGGEVTVAPGGTISSPVISFGTLTLDPGAQVANGGVAFGTGFGGILQISGTSGQALTGLTITNFGPGDTIDLPSIPLASVTGSAFNPANDTFTLSVGGQSDTFTFNQLPSGIQFVLTDDGSGDTAIQAVGLAENTLNVSSGSSVFLTSASLLFSDPGVDPSQITYTVTSLPADGTLTVGGGAATSFTQAEINAGNVVAYNETGFVSAGDIATDGFTFTATDPAHSAAGSGTILISGPPVATPPALVNDSTLTLTGGTTAPITESLLDYSPAQETYTVTTAPTDGELLLNGGATSTFTQADIDGGLLTYSASSVSVTTPDSFGFNVTNASDLSASGTFDITINANTANPGPATVFWTEPSTGSTGYWTFDGSGNISGFDTLGSGNTTYTPLGLGDFDGGGQNEVLWENLGSGDTGYWTVANGVVTGFDDFGIANTTYAIVGIGDFNNAGHAEVLFENLASGDTGFWITNSSGQNITGFNDYGDANTSYKIVGVGDFDGSGHDEVLFENGATGNAGFWITSPAGQVTGFNNFGNAAQDYSVVGVGDFDGSGHDEVLFENQQNGDIGYWITSAGQVTGFHDFGFANTAYHVAGIGDYNSTGRDTLLWENPTTGDTGYWTINGAGQVTGFADLGGANTNYHTLTTLTG